MKQDADVALNPLLPNYSRIDWDLDSANFERYERYWQEHPRGLIPQDIFNTSQKIWLELGAGTGDFFRRLAGDYPHIQFIAVERCRFRGQRLVRRTRRAMLPNLTGIRGNLIPALLAGIPSESLQRIYILYPCPFPKTSQRKNRWYLHPALPHMVRVLEKKGLLIWASDQAFYIDEAHYVCTNHHHLNPMSFGELTPNEWNNLSSTPLGRTKFERTFLSSSSPCYELIVQKS